VIRVIRFCKAPFLWFVSCIVLFIWSTAHSDVAPNVKVPDGAFYGAMSLMAVAGLLGFVIGLFSVADAIHRIDQDERLRQLFELDGIEPPLDRRAK